MTPVEVILVDGQDREVGALEKLRAHVEGRLHRAVSIYVFNARNELLLQRRAPAKYHCGGLWTNTCCGHPMPGEATDAAALRRLREEMGMTCGLEKAFEFSYRAELPGGLIEHEYGHIFFGRSDTTPALNPVEADRFAWRSLDAIGRRMARRPAAFTPWFRLVLPHVVAAFTAANSRKIGL